MKEEIDIAEVRKRAMYNPQSLSQREWEVIHKVAFSVPKHVDSSENAKAHAPSKRQKGKSWW